MAVEGEERRAMGQINHNFMSDEEDGEGDDRGCWVVRSPIWRSTKLISLLSVLQERLDDKESSSKHPKYKQLIGAPSERTAPVNAPEWALRRIPSRDRSRSPVSNISASPEPLNVQESPERQAGTALTRTSAKHKTSHKNAKEKRSNGNRLFNKFNV